MLSQRTTHDHFEPRWRRLYAVLIALNVVAVVGSFLLTQAILPHFHAAVDSNYAWHARQKSTVDLAILAGEATLPALQIPASVSDGEATGGAEARFDGALEAARADARAATTPAEREALLGALDRIDSSRRSLFEVLRRSLERDGGPTADDLAGLARRQATLQANIAELGTVQRRLETAALGREEATVARIRNVELVLDTVILCLVTAVVIFALILSRRSAATREALRDAIDDSSQLRAVFDKHTLFSIADPQGRIVDVNDGFCAISGYSRDELIGRDHRILNSGRHSAEFWRDMWETIRAGKPWTGQVCNRAKDGSHYWVESINIPRLDATGAITQFISLRVDITESKRSAAALEAVKTALDASNDCVFMFDARTLRFVYVNRGAMDQVGYSADEMYAMDPTDIKPDFDEEEFSALLAPLYDRPRESMVFRTRHRHRDGHTIPVEISLQLVRELGSDGRFTAIVRDISDQLEAEERLIAARDEAEAANRSKSEFLANMSHEIRTPMTAILGFSDLLGEADGIADDPDLASEAIRSIRTNANHLLTVINDILDVSKIEAGQMQLALSETDPVAICRETVALVEPRALEKGVELLFEPREPLPARVTTDPTRLRQILINLVGNAVKFTGEGSVRVIVECDAEREQLRFRVIDTGIGMTADQRERICRFEPFTQADSSTSRRFGGSGLGLRISSSLATLLGGRLAVESEEGVGSTVEVTLPIGALAPSAPAAPSADGLGLAPQPEPVAGPGPSLAGVRVLLAEDGPDNQRLISLFIGREGAEVTVCDNGLIAVETVLGLADEALPDVILMDMQMPELDGYGATRRLRDEGIETPIIAVTAHAMDGDSERCLAAGCDGYLTKPINPRELIRTCRHWATREVDDDEAA